MPSIVNKVRLKKVNYYKTNQNSKIIVIRNKKEQGNFYPLLSVCNSTNTYISNKKGNKFK